MSRQATIILGAFAMLLASFVAVSPAAAQWEPVVEVPATEMFSMFSNGDTLAVGGNTAVFLSTDSGKHWRQSSKPAATVTSIQAVRMRNGRLYAGTFGQGVFISDDLGVSWQAFNQGLVGGFANSQLDLSDLQVRGDSLYAATEGAGVYVRNLVTAGTWSHFGEVFEPNQASNVNALGLGGTRLLAAAGDNGMMFFRDPGQAEWTLSELGNTRMLPGIEAQSAAFTGTGWVVGSFAGVFHSKLGQEPWTLTNLRLGLSHTAFTTVGHHLFAAFDIVNAALIEQCDDDGVTWLQLDNLPNVFVHQVAVSGGLLFAARTDGLWRRTPVTLGTPYEAATAGLGLRLSGPDPVRDVARLSFELPQSATASIEVFDVAGRRQGPSVENSWSAGSHEVAWNARDLGSGVYLARLTVGPRHEAVRWVHVR